MKSNELWRKTVKLPSIQTTKRLVEILGKMDSNAFRSSYNISEVEYKRLFRVYERKVILRNRVENSEVRLK